MNPDASLPLAPGMVQPTTGRLAVAQLSFFLLLLLVFVGLSPFSYGLNSLGNLAGEGNVFRQIFFVAISSAIFLSYVERNGIRVFKEVPLPTLAVLLWAVISVLWSVSPEITFRRSALTGLVALAVFWSVALLGPQRSFGMLRLVLIPVIFIDLASVWIVPNATHAYQGQIVWAGMHGHKNAAGAIACFACLLFFHFAVTRRSVVDWCLLVLSLIFLWGTSSKTAMVLMIMALVLYVFYGYAQKDAARQKSLVTLFCLSVVSISVVSWVFRDDIIRFLDDPAIFTGRGLIWQSMLAVIGDHFWLGYGYGAFWEGEASPIRPYLGGSWMLGINNAHNSFMEIMATLGIVGVGLSIVAFVLWPLRHFLSFKVEGGHGPLIFALIAFGVVGSLTKGVFLDTARPEWVVFAMALAILHRDAHPVIARGGH